jgi:hypothetical protein
MPGIIVSDTSCLILLDKLGRIGLLKSLYIDKPDFNMNELVSQVEKSLNKNIPSTHFPYWLGMLGGYGFDILSKLTGKKILRELRPCLPCGIKSEILMRSIIPQGKKNFAPPRNSMPPPPTIVVSKPPTLYHKDSTTFTL